MAKHVVAVIIADLFLLSALYLVLQDLAWRSYYAGTPHVPGSPYTASTSYSLLARFFTMSGSGVSLTSPPTLDWVQLIVLALVVVNGWFAYTMMSKRSSQAPGPTGQDGK